MSECSEYQRRIAVLERENLRLRRENTELRNTIKSAALLSAQLMNIAKATLKNKSGVARGKWSYCRGQFETARRIFDSLAR